MPHVHESRLRLMFPGDYIANGDAPGMACRVRPPAVAAEDLGGTVTVDDDADRPPPWWAGLVPVVVVVGGFVLVVWAVWRVTR